jgi:hypothetical protein
MNSHIFTARLTPQLGICFPQTSPLTDEFQIFVFVVAINMWFHLQWLMKIYKTVSQCWYSQLTDPKLHLIACVFVRNIFELRKYSCTWRGWEPQFYVLWSCSSNSAQVPSYWIHECSTAVHPLVPHPIPATPQTHPCPSRHDRAGLSNYLRSGQSKDLACERMSIDSVYTQHWRCLYCIWS